MSNSSGPQELNISYQLLDDIKLNDINLLVKYTLENVLLFHISLVISDYECWQFETRYFWNYDSITGKKEQIWWLHLGETQSSPK